MSGLSRGEYFPVVRAQGLVSNMAVCFPEAERKPQGSQAMRLEVSHHPYCLHDPRHDLSVSQGIIIYSSNKLVAVRARRP